MSILKKPYELSLWMNLEQTLNEKKVLVLGSDSMTSADRALDVKLTCDVNGTHQLTFKMYYQYYDTQTGELTQNLLTDQIVNESLVKLYYDDVWQDFIIKNIVKNSTDYSYSYTAQDRFINELSKTGFNIEFSDEQGNNMNTVNNLVTKVLEGTDWQLSPYSEQIAQTQKEVLFQGTLGSTLNNVFRLTKQSGGLVIEDKSASSLSSGTVVYFFYSSCADQESPIQFIVPTGNEIQLDSDRVIINAANYRYKGTITWSSSTYGISYPSFVNGITVTTYQGEKYIFSQETKLDTKLNKVVSKYKKRNEDYWGFIETEYNSPALVRNFVSNSTNYESTNGWRTIGNSTLTLDANPSLIERLRSNPPTPIGSDVFTPVLRINLPNYNDYIFNTGLRDNRSFVKELAEGEEFVFYYKGATTIPNLTIQFREIIYNNNTGTYTLGATYLTATSSSAESNLYKTTTASVFTSLSFEDSKNTVIGIVISAPEGGTFDLVDFQVFRCIYTDDGDIMLPSDKEKVEGTITNFYCYFRADTEYTSIKDLTYEKYDEPSSLFTPTIRPGCEKVRSLTVKESNRFNIIQDLCETFECWATFDIEHDSLGAAIGKYVTIHNYIGQDNPARFINGVNLKSVQRTLDSNQLVSKLIVKPNSNQYADGGFCTIATATANPSGETTIFNFDYYINQLLLDPDTLVDDLYTWDENQDGTRTDLPIGYLTHVKSINNQLIPINQKLSELTVTIAQARARVEKASAGLQGAVDMLADINTTLKRYWHTDIEGIRNLSTSSDLYKKLQSVAVNINDPNYIQDKALFEQVVSGLECERNRDTFQSELTDATTLLSNYETLETTLKQNQQTLITQKDLYTELFTTKYARFIQEGTWIDEKYVDDELYFYDARSIGYESSMPKVTYQMNVIDVSVLPEYEGYTFKIGDRTYIQDPEFFGYTIINNVKTPAKEGVTVNKIIYSLDNPSATQITIQTYKNLFQDLFQKITATVQQVHYATGQYEKAAALAEAETAQKVQFLQDALNDAATILTNGAEQTVVWDSTGITITNSNNTSEKLRLVSGGIMLGAPNAQGETEWKVGVTAKGVSASLITSGQLNTGIIQIMFDKEPTFRWDALGLTAYDYTEEGGQVTSTNTNQGVRFDRFGIYGFTGVDGSSWHPSEISAWTTYGQIDTSIITAISAFSTFSLTKEGLYLKLGGLQYGHYYNSNIFPGTFSTPKSHNIKAWLGKGEDILYNSWVYQNNIKLRPYYDYSDQTKPEFVKIFAVYNNSSTETVSIYDDGTFKATDAIIQGNITATSGSFTGSITANSGSIGGFTISDNVLYAGTSPNIVGLSSSTTTNTKMIFAGASDNTGTNAKFYVTNAGKMYATTGSIGMWTVGRPSEVETGDPDRYFYVDAGTPGNPLIMGFQKPGNNGQKALVIGATRWDNWGSGKFYVNFDGAMTATGATITDATISSGTITNAAISSGTITDADIQNGTIGQATITNASIFTSSFWNAQVKNLLTTQSITCHGTLETLAPANLLVKTLKAPTQAGNTSIVAYDIPLEIMQVEYIGSMLYRITISAFIPTTGTIESWDTNVFVVLGYQDAFGIYHYSQTQTNIKNFLPKEPVYNLQELTFTTSILDMSGGNYTLARFYNSGAYDTEIDAVANIYKKIDNTITVTGNIIPSTYSVNSNNVTGYNLGDPDIRWKAIYTHNLYSIDPVLTPSDRRLKQNISLLSSSYDSFFDALRPSTYQWLNESIIHTGFIAQEVADALAAAHLSPSDFYGYRDENPDSLGLAYSEFISLNTWQIQKLKKRVADLEARCSLLEQKLLNQN